MPWWWRPRQTGTSPSRSAQPDRGKALFLEKPLSHDEDGVPRLVETAAGLVVEIGCQMRAHPNLQALAARLAVGDDGPIHTFRAVIGQRLDQWRPGTDYRASYSADAARGGGALLDLVHEIDLVHWLVGPPIAVSAELAKVSTLEIAGDDLANLTLTVAGGAVGQVQLDMLSPAYRRELEIVCRDAVYHWSHADGTLVRRAGGSIEIVDRVPPRFERNCLFMEHMRHFLARLANPDRPALCPLADGAAVLHTALAARRAAVSGVRVRLMP